MAIKIYADFESNIKIVKNSDRSDNTSFTGKKIKNIFLAVLPIKLFVLMINLVKQVFSTEEKMQLIHLLKQFLKGMIIAGE